MQEILFWNQWAKDRKGLYTFALFCFVAAMTWLIYAYTTQYSNILTWQKKHSVESVEVMIGKIQQGLFELPASQDTYVVVESYQPSNILLNPYFSYLNLFFWLVAMCLYLALIGELSRRYYTIGAIVFIVFLIYLQPNHLASLGSYSDAVVVILLLVYLLPSYYMHAFVPEKVGFLGRFFIFLFLSLSVGAWLLLSSPSQYPAVYLANYGMALPALITLIFIVIVAHEIPYWFLFLLTRYHTGSGEKRNTLMHLVVISTIYIGNLALLFLKEERVFEVNIYYLDIMAVFICSVTLGIWGYRQRRALIEPFLGKESQAEFFYLLIAIISLATIAYSFAMGNDTLMQIFLHFILYTHIALGTVFVVYILINFFPLLWQDWAVYRIAYKGDIFSFTTARFLGFALLIILFNQNIRTDYYKSNSAYYTSIADVHYLHKDYSLAEGFYRKSMQYDFVSFHVRYALSTLPNIEVKRAEQIILLRQALLKNPNPFLYAKLTEAYLQTDQLDRAILNLQQGTKLFPENPYLNNQMALLYEQKQVQDSVVYHYKKANAVNNLWAYLAKNKLKTMNLDELPEIAENDTIAAVNQLAVWNLYTQYKPVKLKKEWLETGKLTATTYAYLNNYSINQLIKNEIDTQLIATLKKCISQPINAPVQDNLQMLANHYLYQTGNAAEAVRNLAGNAFLKSSPYHNRTLGLWLIEQQAYAAAATYLETAIRLGDTESSIYLAIALTENNQYETGEYLWQQLATQDKYPTLQQLAQQIIRVMGTPTNIKNDADRFAYIHYQKKKATQQTLDTLYQKITQQEFKIWAAAELIPLYLEKDSIQKATRLFSTLKDTKNLNKSILSQLNLAYLQLLAAQREYNTLKEESERIFLQRPQSLQRLFFKGVALWGLNQTKEAKIWLEKAQQASPFAENIIIVSATFFQQIQQDKEKAYEILVGAVRRNPFSLALQKAYALQALQMRLENFALDALKKVENLTTPQDFEQFKAQFEKQQKLIENN
ncbi:MAG: hypothetical protein EAZ55_05225 [Cytophagales bacterium]|nr:MAG: hypothetical protein EAZ55_05225 [Cytophagales bacterium]